MTTGRQRESMKSAQAWKMLCRHPHIRAADLAELLGWRTRATTRVLMWLKESGCARSEGKSVATRWRATEVRPVDTRGIAQGSIAALRRQQTPQAVARAQKARLAMVAAGTYAVKGRKNGLRPKAESALVGKPLLEQLWPSAPVSAIRTQQLVSVQNMHKPEANPRASAVEHPEDKEAA